MLFALFVFGLLIALGPMFLGMGLVVIGLLSTKEFWICVGLCAGLAILMQINSEYNQTKKSHSSSSFNNNIDKSLNNKVNRNSTILYWIMVVNCWFKSKFKKK